MPRRKQAEPKLRHNVPDFNSYPSAGDLEGRGLHRFGLLYQFAIDEHLSSANCKLSGNGGTDLEGFPAWHLDRPLPVLRIDLPYYRVVDPVVFHKLQSTRA